MPNTSLHSRCYTNVDIGTDTHTRVSCCVRILSRGAACCNIHRHHCSVSLYRLHRSQNSTASTVTTEKYTQKLTTRKHNRHEPTTVTSLNVQSIRPAWFSFELPWLAVWMANRKAMYWTHTDLSLQQSR